MNVETIKQQLETLQKKLDGSIPGSTEYQRFSNEISAIYHEHITVQELTFVAKFLGHRSTDEEDAKMIVAASNGENLAIAMGLPSKAFVSFKILHERLAKGWTQTELGEKVGLSQSQIAKIENVQQIPDVDTASRLLVALNASMNIGIQAAE